MTMKEIKNVLRRIPTLLSKDTNVNLKIIDVSSPHTTIFKYLRPSTSSAV